MSVTVKQVFFTFAPDSLIESWKKRLLMVVIDIDTGHQIKYVILTNDSKLHNKDRETTLRIRIINIATEVSGENRNSERGHCINWYTASEMSIKGH